MMELTPPPSPRRGSGSTMRPKKKIMRIVRKGNKFVYKNSDENSDDEDDIKTAQQKTEKELEPEKQISKSRWKNEDQIFYLRTAFGLLDRNQDGRVTATELQFMLKNLGIHISDELVDDLMKEASHSGNTLIDEAEFLQWIARIEELREEATETKPETVDIDDEINQDLIAAFKVFDRDGNGYITRDELQIGMEMMGETVTDQQVTELLTLADLDKDGKINYEEFARLLL